MLSLRLAMAQINPTVGDLKGNARKIIRYIEKAKDEECDLVIFPELAVTGYPPEDLLLKPQFIDDNRAALKEIARGVTGIAALVGFVDKGKGGLFNGAAVIHRRKIAAVCHKIFLPNYGVFDEKRYFQAGTTPMKIVINGVTVGVGICEDVWHKEGPVRFQALHGAEVVVNINASPYYMGKQRLREEVVQRRARENGIIVAYNNMVGGQDELVFDGQGMVIDRGGEVIARGRAFREELIVADLECEGAPPGRRGKMGKKGRSVLAVRELTLSGKTSKKKRKPLVKRVVHLPGTHEEVYRALLLGTKDYVRKNRFRHAVIGLSGGIDSSLVAAVATDALGGNNVTGVFMPSPYSSRASSEDAHSLARNLGMDIMTLPITEIFQAYTKLLRGAFRGQKRGVAEENLQARIRGSLIMALSNKFGWLVLTTGNKSEMSVGYATLYGDMAGGFAVIKDIPKMLVYELSRYRNRLTGGPVIPERVLTRAPSAELKPNQRDQDTLPDYDTLDAVLRAYVEENRGLKGIVGLGFEKELTRKVISMVDGSEYKRRQAPPGIKITPRAFGKDRRMPITNRYRST
ncbi:MAG: NAD+ synthase [Thermodesulfobacteriota bacterium]